MKGIDEISLLHLTLFKGKRTQCHDTEEKGSFHPALQSLVSFELL
jgi:hypothetical protein